jgi:cytidine deaminase
LFNALTSGENKFTAIAIVARVNDGAMPCGACRQLLSEYAPDAVIWVSDSAKPKKIREFTIKELLPGAFLNFTPV